MKRKKIAPLPQLALWRILLFVLAVIYVKLTISLQKR